MVGKFQLTGERRTWIENSLLRPPSSFPSHSKFQNWSPWPIMYEEGQKSFILLIEASWNKGKSIGFGGAAVLCLLPQRLKIPCDKNAHCQEEQETGELGLNFCGLESGLQTSLVYAASAREFPHIPTSLFLFLVLEWALSLRHCQEGVFSLFSFSPPLSLSVHPVLTMYCCYCWRGSIYLVALIWVARVRSQQASVTTWWD